MAWSRKRKAALQDDLDLLLNNLCSEWGFCGRLRGDGLLALGQPLTAAAFAEAVIVAEGFPPGHGTEWREQIVELFTQRYGPATSPERYASTQAVEGELPPQPKHRARRKSRKILF